DEIAGGSQGPHQAVETMRALHPKLNIETIRKRLEGTDPDHPPSWSNADFWRDEIDLALLDGIHDGSKGQSIALDRIITIWPKLDRDVLRARMEELALDALPEYLREKFWTGELDRILLEGIRQGKLGERRAVDKILKIRPGLRIEIVWSR